MTKYKLLKTLPQHIVQDMANKLAQPRAAGKNYFMDGLVDMGYLEPIPEKKEWCSQTGMYLGDKLYTGEWLQTSLSFRHGSQADNFENKLKALKAIWKWKENNDGEFVPDWEDAKQDKYEIFYTKHGEILSYFNSPTSKAQAFLPYYSNLEITKLAIKHLEQEYKTILTK